MGFTFCAPEFDVAIQVGYHFTILPFGAGNAGVEELSPVYKPCLEV